MKTIKSVEHSSQEDMAPDLREMARDTIESRIRAHVLDYVAAIMKEEVTALCGSPFERKGEKGLYHRGGSESGSIIISGECIFKRMISGISTRSYNSVIEKYEKYLGVSKSTVSRQFAKKAREALNELNRREFPDLEFWVLLMTAFILVAMGIDLSGNKHFLGISQGSVENSEIVKSFLFFWIDE